MLLGMMVFWWKDNVRTTDEFTGQEGERGGDSCANNWCAECVQNVRRAYSEIEHHLVLVWLGTILWRLRLARSFGIVRCKGISC